MDTHNFFFTRATSINARLEYTAILAVCAGLLIYHWGSVNIWLGLLLFAYIDLIGTVPSLIAAHRSTTGRIHRGYYVAYNILHSLVTQIAFTMVYVLLFGWQWCLLAIPVHLCVDRAMFNNYPKPFGVAFDPVEHPAFAEFVRNYEQFDPDTADWKAIKAANAGNASAPAAQSMPVG